MPVMSSCPKHSLGTGKLLRKMPMTRRPMPALNMAPTLLKAQNRIPPLRPPRLKEKSIRGQDLPDLRGGGRAPTQKPITLSEQALAHEKQRKKVADCATPSSMPSGSQNAPVPNRDTLKISKPADSAARITTPQRKDNTTADCAVDGPIPQILASCALQ